MIKIEYKIYYTFNLQFLTLNKFMSDINSNTQETTNQTLYLAAGCFWCVEAIFDRIQGVVSLRSGYCNGQTSNPTYREICTGNTGHAEVIEVVFNPKILPINDLLEIFFATHDPTTLNRQGADVGTQYRSGIFYSSEAQKQAAQAYISTLNNASKITTELSPIAIFYPAEDYHQNYFNDNQSAPYCRAVIAPKIKKYFG